ncbi:MAG: VCBS repeat-containing protein, partial [Bacteroidota bacterium]
MQPPTCIFALKLDMHKSSVHFSFCLAVFCCLYSACDQREVQPVSACFSEAGTLFTNVACDPATGIRFSNDLTYTEQLNPYTYRNFYNGGGVGIADFNGDGLQDIFFTGNLVDNQLYLNRGDFTFEEVTETAGVACSGSWSTGVAIIDIDADGDQDIYVCKAGPPAGEQIMGMMGVRHNELFLNNGDATFREAAAEFGLDVVGLSVHAAFFDYDQDGDLDCYLLNNSTRSTTGYNAKAGLRDIPDPTGGNKLLRNLSVEGKEPDAPLFMDVTSEANIYSSAIGFGLGVTVGDVNADGLPDLFVSNDYFERDYLYFNQGNGTFQEKLPEYLPEISKGSMGADFADLTGDGLPELFVTEMLPRTEQRRKTKAAFDDWNRYQLYRDQGYHQQFSRNVLQHNRGGGRFSEVGRMAGVAATDWSWGALLFDLDNDGRRDIFVANGVGKDLLDQDYINFDA